MSSCLGKTKGMLTAKSKQASNKKRQIRFVFLPALSPSHSVISFTQSLKVQKFEYFFCVDILEDLLPKIFVFPYWHVKHKNLKEDQQSLLK